MSKLLESLETEALEQIAEIRKFRTYQGQNPEYKHRAKVAIGLIGACVRLRATIANEETNRLVARRMDNERFGPPLPTRRDAKQLEATKTGGPSDAQSSV